ncbi:hypothetical protein MY04_1883 [Flammeovirga sp. MY04]|uniref:hypothetical protein n=1 Tax=Flammeovirga sp. MY04 TaxID=1191459 RepID=UPI0008060B88|nr:hypothetical protein [Flammeovirga sp. MY04]ANQ49257.1 hypothetical protein MY04_1883 [Flammeovirga sp. MY04]
MKHIATLLSFIILSHFSIGQNVRFQIVDPHQKGIPYVNFYSQKAKIGKVSNQEGWIELPSENLSTNNEFTISCIGFIKKKLKGNEILNGNKRIVLEEDTKELSEVSIQAEKIKFKKKKLGVDVKSGMFQIGFMNINSKEGGSIAQIMNNKTLHILKKLG